MANAVTNNTSVSASGRQRTLELVRAPVTILFLRGGCRHDISWSRDEVLGEALHVHLTNQWHTQPTIDVFIRLLEVSGAAVAT